MGVPWNTFALTAAAGSVLCVQFAPQWSISASYLRTFLSLFLAQGCIGLFWSVIIRPRFFSPLRHLPSPAGGNPFYGHFWTIMKEPSGVPMQRWINEVPNDGLIHYLNFGNESRLMPTSPKALAEVLSQKSYDFIKPPRMRKNIARLLGDGILLAEGDEHKRQRKDLMPAFAFRHVKDLYPIFWSKSCEMVKAIQSAVQAERNQAASDSKEAPSVEFGQWASRATLDIIGVAGMGHDFQAIQNPDAELASVYRSIFQPSRQARTLAILSFIVPIWFLQILPFKRNDDIRAAIRTIREVCRQLIEEKKEKLAQKEGGKDIISVALESGGFTDENLIDQCMTFLAAGHETTATAMIWAVYLLCRHPEHQTRLREEIRTFLPSTNDPDSTVTSDLLDKMPFLNAVCNEVLRMWAPVSLTIRQAARDSTIQNQFVPAGTMIIMCSWAIHYSTELWGADAAAFNPDRWMGPGRANSGGAESNYSFMTFLHGPRSCIGQAFAKAEFSCLVASLVGRFEMELLDPDVQLDIGGGITAKPKGGLMVRMKEVEGW